MSDDDVWPPPEAQVRAALWQAEGHLLRAEWAQADRVLAPAVRLTTDPVLIRALRRLAAAGYKASEGDAARATRQLAIADGLLGACETDEVDLAGLLDTVARAVGDARAGGR